MRLLPGYPIFQRLRLLLAGLFVATTIRAAEAEVSVMRPADWQDRTTLTSGWQFVRKDLGGVWETLRSKDRALDLPAWSTVELPHCYNATDAVDPDGAYYQGPAWYRTELKIENPHVNGRTLLHFEGAGQKAQIWIGDEKVSEHVGGYDEFTVDITDAIARYRSSALAKLPATESRIAPGSVPLAVRCDN